MDGLIMRIGEDGVCREYKEPYATVECDTEEDFKALEEAVAFWEKHRWIPVTERLPKPLEYVLILTQKVIGDLHVSIGRYSRLTGLWYIGEYSTQANITHWMPLPDAPKEDSK